MNSESEKVRFQIVRKWAFAEALLTYKLFINGEYAGRLKNGKTLNVDVPKSDYYYIDEMWASDERNAIICEADLNDPSQIFVEIRSAGGWKTSAYNEFFVRENGEYAHLPSFDYSRYYQACYEDNLFSELTEQERIFTRCLEFFNEISDGADVVLHNQKLFEMLDALQAIGAEQYTCAFTSAIKQIFHGIPLPISDEMLEDDEILKRTKKANMLVRDSEKKNGSAEELHKCLVTFILTHFYKHGS